MKANKYELGLIYILLLKPELLKTLQVKPEYLEDSKLSNILRAFIKKTNESKDFSVVDLADGEPFDVNDLASIISDEESIVLNPEKDYVPIQKQVIKLYKQRETKQLANKTLNLNQNPESYKSELDRILAIDYQDEQEYLTYNGMLETIEDEQQIIKLKCFPKLDNALQLVRNDLLVIGAKSGLGKTSFMLNIMNSLMKDYNCIYINLEMSPSTLLKRMVAIKSGVKYASIKKPKTAEESDLINAGIYSIADSKVTLINGANTIEQIEDVLKVTKTKKHTIMFIDHLGLIQNKGKSLYERTTLNAQAIRVLSLKYGVTMIVASQLNRDSVKSEEPDLTSFKDSGEVENSARKAIVLYANDPKDVVNLNPVINVKIVKNDTGRMRTVPMKFEKEKQIFEEI